MSNLLKELLLIILVLNYRVLNLVVVPTNPCPDVFQYKTRQNSIFGEITVTYDGSVFNELILNVSYPFHDSIRKLKIDLETSFSDIRLTQRIKYYVTFPYLNQLPSVLLIKYNQKTICRGSVPSSAANTILWQTHNFYIYVEDNFNINTETARNEPSEFVINWKSWNEGNVPDSGIYVEQKTFKYPAATAAQTTTSFVSRVNNILDQSNCGQIRTDNKLTYLVVGGKQTSTDKYPWLVALYHLNDYKCTANLISNQHILTAAHCVYRVDPEEIQVILGTTSLDQVAFNTETPRIKRITSHSDYRQGKALADIAVIILEQQVTFRKNIAPICLWSKEMSDGRRNGIVAGWGADGNSRSTKMPYEINLAMVSNAECLKSKDDFQWIINKYTFCAGNRDGTGPCNGDSGAGYMVIVNNKYFIRGLVSSSLNFYNSCDLNNYIVFVDIEKYLDWIYKLIQT